MSSTARSSSSLASRRPLSADAPRARVAKPRWGGRRSACEVESCPLLLVARRPAALVGRRAENVFRELVEVEFDGGDYRELEVQQAHHLVPVPERIALVEVPV